MRHKLFLSPKKPKKIGVIVIGLILLVVVANLAHNLLPYSIKIQKNNTESARGTSLNSSVANTKSVTSAQKITFGTVPESALSAPPSQRSAELKKIKDAGFTVVRIGFNWSIIEPAQGKFVWTDTDIWMKAARDAGLSPIVEIDRVPEWNRPAACRTDPNCAPVRTDEFGAFAAAAVKRYMGYNVAAWEIWNEPNTINFWKPIPNPNQYAHLLDSSYRAIKKTDPNAVVLFGGLAGDSVDVWGSSYMDPRTFVAQVYAAGGKNSFDALGYHPYIKPFGLPNENDVKNGWAKMATGDNNIRSIMSNNGDTQKKIWITEFGVTTGGRGTTVTDPEAPLPKGADHVSYDAQVEIAQAVFAEMKQYDWIQNFVWYSYKDGSNSNTDSAAGYGIWDNKGQPKPVLEVIKQAMRQQ